MGYLLGGALVGRGLDWRNAFYIQTGCLIPVLLSIFFTPLKYLDLENKNLQLATPIPAEIVQQPADPRASFSFIEISSDSAAETSNEQFQRGESTLDRVKDVLSTRVFVCTALALSTLYYITAGI